MSQNPQTDRLMSSLTRCFDNNENFLGDFYEHFLNSNEEIAEMFKNTDMRTQEKLLKGSLTYVLLFADDSEFARENLLEIAQSHSRQGLGVRPELYPHWLDNLLITIRDSDPDFNPDLEKDWRTIFQKTVDLISKHY
jgi:hemoglobin-like flavoprotein